MRAWRIAGAAHKVFDGAGAALVGGRWNPIGAPAIYAAETYALALLEVLLHAQIGRPPPRSRFVEIEIPSRVSVEEVTDAPAGWDHPDYSASQAFGARWIAERRGAVLLVPSVISPTERNVVINPTHPDAARIKVSAERDLTWDERIARLFGGG